jgi:hypothetical protein
MMFETTGTQNSPWVVIKGNNKDLARKEAMRYVLKNIEYNQKGLTGVGLDYDPEIIRIIKNKK